MLNYIVWEGIDGIKIGYFIFRFYSLMFICSFFLGKLIIEYIFKKEQEDIKKIEKIFIYTFLGTVLGARLGHVIFYQTELFKYDPLSIIFPFRFFPKFQFTGFHGLSSHGALIGVIISTLIVSHYVIKKKLLWLLDRMVIPFTLGGFFVRLGNFFNSEIIGKPFESRFAVLFINQDTEYGSVVPRHASQIYESIAYFILFIILFILYIKTNKKKYLGWFFSVFMISLWSIRFVIEFTKEPQGNEYITLLNFNSGQILSIPMIIIGIVLLHSSLKKECK